MALSKKGKRKIIYNEEIFYWYIKSDEDYGTDYLNIIKEDCSIVIFYRVNQISDEFIHPKVFIEKSNRLKTVSPITKKEVGTSERTTLSPVAQPSKALHR